VATLIIAFATLGLSCAATLQLAWAALVVVLGAWTLLCAVLALQ
jgi:hypothetical protein